MAMIFDEEFYYQREHYMTRVSYLVRQTFCSEEFHHVYRGMGTPDGNKRFEEYLDLFCDKILELVHNAEYNIFYLILWQIYPETDGVIPDAEIAKKSFLQEENPSQYRIYLLMLLEDLVKHQFMDDEENFNDYKFLFKIRDEPP